MDRIYIQFADNGNIRKWQREPFDGGTEFLSASLPGEVAGVVERLAEVERERENMRAALTARVKTMLRLRDALVEVHDNIEDEGDRVYFGSTNDADQLKKVWHELDGWNWDDIMSDGKLADVYESSRKAHARAEAAEARLAEAMKVVEEAAAEAETKSSEPAPKIDMSALDAWFPDGVPVVATKIMFPEKSDPLTTAEVRHVLAALAAVAHPSPDTEARLELTRERVARALHAVDCADADRDRKIEGLPPVEKWADPWLPTGKHQLDSLFRRADVFLSALSTAAPEGREAVEYAEATERFVGGQNG